METLRKKLVGFKIPNQWNTPVGVSGLKFAVLTKDLTGIESLNLPLRPTFDLSS